MWKTRHRGVSTSQGIEPKFSGGVQTVGPGSPSLRDLWVSCSPWGWPSCEVPTEIANYPLEFSLKQLAPFPPGISLNKTARQQLAHGKSLPVFCKFRKYFGLSCGKSLFPDQQLLWVMNVPKPICSLGWEPRPLTTQNGALYFCSSGLERKAVPLAKAAEGLPTSQGENGWISLLHYLSSTLSWPWELCGIITVWANLHMAEVI